MPSTLEKFGLVPALREICDRFQATALTPINFLEQGEIRTIEAKRALKIFRIVQELVNNAIKHAQASTINVNVSGEEQLKITVQDDGIGFDPKVKSASSQNGSGLGLYNMENRTRLLNARLEFDTQLKKGSKITLIVPYETTESLHS